MNEYKKQRFLYSGYSLAQEHDWKRKRDEMTEVEKNNNAKT